MAKHKIEVLICDRCGHREEIRRAEQHWKWGLAAYREVNGGKWAAWSPGGDDNSCADICPSCLHELHVWWEAPKNQAEAADDPHP